MHHFLSEAFHRQDTEAQRVIGDLVSWWWIQERRFSSLTGITLDQSEFSRRVPFACHGVTGTVARHHACKRRQAMLAKYVQCVLSSR